MAGKSRDFTEASWNKVSLGPNTAQKYPPQKSRGAAMMPVIDHGLLGIPPDDAMADLLNRPEQPDWRKGWDSRQGNNRTQHFDEGRASGTPEPGPLPGSGAGEAATGADFEGLAGLGDAGALMDVLPLAALA